MLKNESFIKKFEVIDTALSFSGNLVISDIHLGYEEALNKQGIFMPRHQFKDTAKRLEEILSFVCKTQKLKLIILNGDLKHEFSTISEQEWRDVKKIIGLLKKNCERLVIVKGNHDTILGPIAQAGGVEIVEHLVIDDILFLHGHKLPSDYGLSIPAQVKTIVVGHSHPAVMLSERMRNETFKCFLYGRWKKYNLVIMPSFNTVVEGTDVIKDELIGPFADDIVDFNVFVPVVSQDATGFIETQVLEFGKVSHLRELAEKD